MSQIPMQTVVYMKDVSARHMELILEYMYKGEINVQENDLMGLLNTAKGLQIKGLSDGSNDDASGNKSRHLRPKPRVEPPKAALKRSAEADDSQRVDESDIKRVKDESTVDPVAGPSDSISLLVEEPTETIEQAVEEETNDTTRDETGLDEIEEGIVEEYGGEDYEETTYENEEPTVGTVSSLFITLSFYD